MKRAVRRVIQAYISISLLGFGLAYADNSHLQSFNLDKGSEAIHIQVIGEGFDPLLRVQKTADGSYQVICEGTPLTVNPSARQSLNAFKTNLKRQYPEITHVDLQEAGQTIRLVITSRQRLQPQILSNTGKQIALKLLQVKSGSESEANGKTLDNVELDLNEQLSQRQQQENTRRELIKAQEQAWQQQAGKKTSLNSSDSKPSDPKTKITIPEVKTTFSLHSMPPVTTPTVPPMEPAETPIQEDPEPVSPLRLTTPPPSAFQNNAQAIYQAVGQSISGESLYAFITDPKVPMDVQTGIRQAFQGDLGLAKTTLQNYVQNHPGNITAPMVLAMVLLNNNSADPAYTSDRNQAITLLNQVVSQTPYVKAYELLIDIALDDNRISDAESLLNKAELLVTNDPNLLFLKGRVLEAQNNLDTARGYYLQVLEQVPQLTEAHYRLAQIALKSAKPKEAAWELGQILQVTPDDVRALKLLAFITQRDRQNKQALTLYQKALQPDVMLNLARLLSEQGESAKANALLSAVETLLIDNPDLLFNIGMTYADIHNAGKARNLLNRFIQQANSQDTRVTQAKEALKKLGR